jgi:hypothetical protein
MGKLAKRLTSQLKANGQENPEAVAYALLNKRGQAKGAKLTEHGKARERLGNAGRAKDRAVKEGGGKPSDYAYDPGTNRTRKK